MVKELWGEIRDFLGKMFRSRLFPLALVFVLLFCVLIGRLFRLQIVDAEEYQENYVQKTRATLTLASTRGNIYDCNGRVLATNELVYQVTFRDTGAYTTHQQKNTAAFEIAELIDSQGETLDTEIPIRVGEDGEYEFSTLSESRIRRFLIDLMGTDYIEELADKGEDVYSWSADRIVEYMENRYYFSSWKDADGNPMELTNERALEVLNIRYKLTLTAYSKYQSVLIADDVSEETVAAALEYSSTIEGLNVEESSKRVYPYGKYCASILGYTKYADAEELAALQEEYPDAGYQSGDIIGTGGIEETMEYYLQGRKGSQTVYLDSQGQILDVVSVDEAVPGNDIYLNIDIEKQVGIYNLLEQMIAGILVQHLVIDDEVPEQQNPEIPVKDVYTQLISNNVLDVETFSDADASEVEQQMYAAFAGEFDNTVAQLREQLTTQDAAAYNSLSETMQTYIDYIYNDLLANDWGILKTSEIDRSDPVYTQWRNGEISFQAFLRQCIAQEWIDVSELETEDRYSSAEQLYQNLVDSLLQRLEDNRDFSELVYEYLIRNDVISGNQVCAALFYQDVLPYDEAAVASLLAGNRQTAFEFIREKINNLEITPDQLALDPCSGAVVVTDVDTGKVLSIVSYPGYDNNYFSGTVDADYYNSLLENQSLPLFNRATQTTIAPGSTFKMVSMAAALGEGIIDPYTQIDCTVVYDKVSPAPSCWNQAGHGPVNIWQALAGSCNFYFYEVGYRLSTTDSGTLNSAQGVERLAKYAEMFGLGEKSGIEMTESAPHVSDTEAIASAIGQGTHAYSTVGLSRYVTAIASRGNVYQLSLLDSVQSKDGEMVEEYEPVIESTVDLSEQTWDIICEAMRDVVTSGSIVGYMDDAPVEVAAKTGTAQEDLTRSEHAQFVSFAPYDDPEITVTITIPNGYTSGNNTHLASQIYQFWYGAIDNEDIESYTAYQLDSSDVIED